MKLILASQGFTTPEIAEAVAELAGKPLTSLNVAIINEAYTGIAAGRHEGWLINELSLIAQYAKGTISFVNLRAYDIAELEQRLEFADMIYIVGGAQLVLPKLFRESGFDSLLSKLAAKKVIMGTSAGANVLGAHIEDPDYWHDQYDDSGAYLTERFLGLVDFNILPHFEREDHPRRNTEILTPLLKDNPFPLYGVTDSQAVVYDNGATKFVGGNPAQFGSN
jgi:dipeptidase E